MVTREEFETLKRATKLIVQGVMDTKVEPSNSMRDGIQILTDFLTEHSNTPNTYFIVPKAVE